MKIIESLDEALYSVMSWLIFFPLTLWRTLIHPQRMMDHADREMSDRPDEQYEDAIRPPLFLFLALLVSHGLEVATVARNPLLADNRGLAALVDSDLALLGLRLLLFSLFPLMMAVRLLRRQGARLTHASLRRPFYSQCYTTAPFALLLGIGSLIAEQAFPGARAVGLLTVGVGSLWYLSAEARWFTRKLGVSKIAGIREALVATFWSVLLFLLAAIVVVV